MPPRDSCTLAVPFCDLAAVNRELRPQLDAAYRRVMESGQLILGCEVDAFEREWAGYCGRKYAVGVGNGMDAISLMLRAYGIGPNDGVIVPAHTCVATWMGVTAVGAIPIPVDADWLSFQIDADLVQSAIELQDPGSVRAILAVHLYGIPSPMTALRSIASSYGIPLLVDAAQAHGITEGFLGDAAAFSFYPTKNLGALGDGGAVVTDDIAIASHVALLRNYGSITKNRNECVGANSRLDELQAAFLRAKLPYLDRFNARRYANASKYGLVRRGVHHQCVTTVAHRDVFRQKMQERGIETMVHYPTPCHMQPAYQNCHHYGRFPVAERLAREVVSLPCGPELNPEQIEHVAAEWVRE